MSRGKDTPVSRSIRWASRVFFVAAALAAAVGVWLRTQQPRPTARSLAAAPVAIDWHREPFEVWSSAEDGIRLEYPRRYEPVRGFGRFTSRDLDGGRAGTLRETDLVAFRSAEPRSVINVAVIQAPKAMEWKEWEALARTQPGKPGASAEERRAMLGSSFGGSDAAFTGIRVAGIPGLAVRAVGAVRYPERGNDRWELWRFESLFLARGDRAVRITAGVHRDQFAGAEPGIRRVLATFRWATPPD